MHVKFEDFKTGWFGLRVGLTDSDIVDLIDKLTQLRQHKAHFHARSDFSGAGGVGDIEFYFAEASDTPTLTLE